VDIAGNRFLVEVPDEFAEWIREVEMRRILNRALRSVGLDCYRVAFVFVPPAGDRHCNT
jgi:hypothetical protein